MEKIDSINGKTSNKKEWFRLNKHQVLELNKTKARIVYPFKIGKEVIKRNLFISGGLGTFILILVLIASILLIAYNNSLNLEECKEIIEKQNIANAGEFILEGDNEFRETNRGEGIKDIRGLPEG